MKVIKTITVTAAVVSCCIGNPLSVEAKNGWMQLGYNNGQPVFWRVRGCQGDICAAEIRQGLDQYLQWFN